MSPIQVHKKERQKIFLNRKLSEGTVGGHIFQEPLQTPITWQAELKSDKGVDNTKLSLYNATHLAPETIFSLSKDIYEFLGMPGKRNIRLIDKVSACPRFLP